MNTKQKAAMYEAIQKHGENLNAIFKTDLDPVTLCKRLKRLENKARQLCVDECNTGADHDAELEIILNRVRRLLGVTDPELSNAIFINGDPRGYALKIKDSYVRDHDIKIERDWGGYGLIAPDFTPN